MQEIKWSCLEFGSLSVQLLYAVLQLRSAVFVLEQNCPYQDMDDRDEAALHVMGHLDEKLVCYARVLPPGLKYDGASIGRVITAQSLRGGGYGKALMSIAIEYSQQHFPAASITLSAQHQLESFYVNLGFITVSEPYMEDGIPHIEMLMQRAESRRG